MITTTAVVLYVVFAILVGICGSRRRMGFIGTFILSLLLTPILMLIVLMITGPAANAGVRRRARAD